MNITEAVVIWTPARHSSAEAGTLRVERRDYNWKRTPGCRWSPATGLSTMEQIDAEQDLEQKFLALFKLFNTITVTASTR
jgi:hypothetical protein